jgi:hypothetical protein
MAQKAVDQDDQYSPEEAAKRRDAVVNTLR